MKVDSLMDITDQIEFDKPTVVKWNGKNYKRNYKKKICGNPDCGNTITVHIVFKDGAYKPITNGKYARKKFCSRKCGDTYKGIGMRGNTRAKKTINKKAEQAFLQFLGTKF